MPISPTPFTPSGVTSASGSSTKITSMSWMSALAGTWYSAKLWFMKRPSRWSISVSSCSAMPMPITTPPRIWLRAVLGLMIRPAATALTMRVTRTTPSSSSTFTSAKIALCVLRDLRIWLIMPLMPGRWRSPRPRSPAGPPRASPRRSSTATAGSALQRDARRRMKSTSSIPASPSGSPSIFAAAFSSFSPTARQASCTAAPVEAAIHEPPSTGESAGRSRRGAR